MNDETDLFAGETLRFGFQETRAGLAAVAASDRGVAAILLGSDRGELRQKLGEALPGATLVEDEIRIAATLEAVGRMVDQPGWTPDFAFDLRGRTDELAVWHALRAIPAGETRSYGTIAKADGSLAGYRWGAARKRRLLAMESAA